MFKVKFKIFFNSKVNLDCRIDTEEEMNKVEACRSSVLDQMSKLHNFISDLVMMPFYILGFASSRKVSSRKIFYIRFVCYESSVKDPSN